jgi:hypothetical protein
MAPTLRSTLVRIGVIEDLKPGRPRKYFGEEGAKLKRELQARKQIAFRQKVKAAAERGEPRVVLPRGRPRIYETEEEAKLAKTMQTNESRLRMQSRYEEGIKKLEDLLQAVPT